MDAPGWLESKDSQFPNTDAKRHAGRFFFVGSMAYFFLFFFFQNYCFVLLLVLFLVIFFFSFPFSFSQLRAGAHWM